MYLGHTLFSECLHCIYPEHAVVITFQHFSLYIIIEYKLFAAPPGVINGTPFRACSQATAAVVLDDYNISISHISVQGHI